MQGQKWDGWSVMKNENNVKNLHLKIQGKETCLLRHPNSSANKKVSVIRK